PPTSFPGGIPAEASTPVTEALRAATTASEHLPPTKAAGHPPPWQAGPLLSALAPTRRPPLSLRASQLQLLLRPTHCALEELRVLRQPDPSTLLRVVLVLVDGVLFQLRQLVVAHLELGQPGSEVRVVLRKALTSDGVNGLRATHHALGVLEVLQVVLGVSDVRTPQGDHDRLLRLVGGVQLGEHRTGGGLQELQARIVQAVTRDRVLAGGTGQTGTGLDTDDLVAQLVRVLTQ